MVELIIGVEDEDVGDTGWCHNVQCQSPLYLAERSINI